jgi:prepilin-type N-terminal cleavage/methylation domain-containing protein
MSKRKSARSGFTLAEVLVTIALIGALAAVVVPTIAGQLTKGDPNRVAADYNGIRGAVEQFLSDVRKYPANINELTNPITTSQLPMGPSGTSVFSTADVARWRGPYLSKDSISAGVTGFGYTAVLALDSLTSTTTTATTNYTGCTVTCTKYMVLKLGLAGAAADSAAWAAVDASLDDGAALTGFIRYKVANPIKMIVVPIQP